MTARKSSTRKSTSRSRQQKPKAPVPVEEPFEGETATTSNFTAGAVPPVPVEVNNDLVAPPPPEKGVDIVTQVLRGDWGKGQERRLRLKAAGHDHREVQAEIVRRRNLK